jgi:hypothetical protein
LKREGFAVEVGNFEDNTVFDRKNFKSARQIRDAAKKSSKREWAGFQLYYPIPEKEVRASTGYELVKAITDVFAEVMPSMNCCMQVPLTSSPRSGPHQA